VQAATASAAATARTKDPARIALIRVGLAISQVAPARARENFVAGTANIFSLHVLVDHQARIDVHGRRHGRDGQMPEMHSRHRYMFLMHLAAFDLNLLVVFDAVKQDCNVTRARGSSG
jgi:hypothetical protein